jgi:hypothetical protein
MKALKELIDIYTSNNNLPLKAWLASNINANAVFLYMGIARGQWETDADASIALYGSPNSAAYRKIKFDLKAKLLSFMIFTEINQEGNAAHVAQIKSIEAALLTAKLTYFQADNLIQELDCA